MSKEPLSWRSGTFIFARLGIFIATWMAVAAIGAFATRDVAINNVAVRGVLLGGNIALPLAVLSWFVLDLCYFSKRWDYLTGKRAIIVALIAMLLFVPLVLGSYGIFAAFNGPEPVF